MSGSIAASTSHGSLSARALATAAPRLPPAARRVYDTLIDVLTGAFFLFLAAQGFLLARITADLTMAATELPTSLIVWPVVIGGALSAMHCVIRIAARFSGETFEPQVRRELV